MSKFNKYVHFNFYFRFKLSDIGRIKSNKNTTQRDDSSLIHILIDDDNYMLGLVEKLSGGYNIVNTHSGGTIPYSTGGYISSLCLYSKEEGRLVELSICNANTYHDIHSFQLCLTPKHAKSFRILSNYGMLLELSN